MSLKFFLEERETAADERRMRTWSICMGFLDMLEYCIQRVLWPFFQIVQYFRKRKWRQ